MDFECVTGRFAAAVAVSTLMLYAVVEAGPAEAADPEDVVDAAVAELEWEGATSPDAISASALARIRGVLVEDLSQRTEVSQTFALPDGQWRTDISTGPEWVATGEDPATDEGWARADSSLVPNGAGGFAPKAHVAGLQFSGGSDGRTEVVTGQDASGEPFSLWWDGALPEPVVAEDAIRYVDAEPGIDLVFQVTATGYEQFFVVKDAEALEEAEELAIEFAAPESDLVRVGDGVVVRNDDGHRVAQVSDVSAWDAASDALHVQPVAQMAPAPVNDDELEATPAPEVTADLNELPTIVDVPVDVSVSGDVAEISIDTGALPFDESSDFPVVIDPSANLTVSFDTYVSDAWLSDRSGQTELLIGTANSGADKFRSFLNVNVSPIVGKKVTAATLKLYNHHSWSCSAKGWEVWSTSTTSTSTRWTNMPSLSTKYASSTATKGYSSSCAGGYVSADITTMAQAWSTGTATSKGIGIKAASETDNAGWKRFSSGNASSNKPVISVTYNSYPNTPSSVKVAGTAPAAGATVYTNDTTPTFSAVVSDPDGGNVRGLFTVKQGSTTTVSAASGSSVASGSTSSYTSAALAQGKAYSVSVAASDGSSTSRASSSPTWTVFVDTAAPGATSITSPQFTNGQWKDTAPSSVGATLSATDAVKFEYKVDSGAVKTVVATSGSATLTGLPRTNGGHRVEARAVDRANNTSAWTVLEYGIGSVGITAPASDYKTTDRVRIVASAPPAGSGSVERSLYWRASGTPNGAGYSDATGSSAGWTRITANAPGDVAAGVNPSVDYPWDSSQAAESLGKERVPFLMDVQVCFTYTYTSDTLCTWRNDESTHATVLRVPHAFGDNFPVASAGPGQVAMWTGEFNTSTTDLAVPGYTGTLSVSRTYSTFAGGREDSVFGPGWAPSFEGTDVGAAGLTVIDATEDNGLLILEDVDGTYLLYQQPGGTTEPQKAGEYVALDADTAALGYRLKVTGEDRAARLSLVEDDGVTTTWAHLGSGEWVQESVVEPGQAGATTFTRDGSGRITRILAPVPAGVSCTPTLSPGCRALDIAYYTSTNASTDAFAGRVASVTYRAWDPAIKAMGSLEVARYKYDATGHLKTVVDPRSGIQTTYEYSGTSKAQVPFLTAVKPGGLAAWRMQYDDDPQGSGSLLRVSRDGATDGAPQVTMSRYIYGIDMTAAPSGVPDAIGAVHAWGQTRIPALGFATFGPGEDPGTNSASAVSAAAWKNANLTFTDAEGYTLNTAEFGAGLWLYTAIEFDDGDRVVRSLDTAATSHLLAQSVLNDGQPVAQEIVNAVASITRYNDDIVAGANYTWDGGSIAAGTVLVPAGTLVTDTWAPASDDAGNGLARIHTQFTYDEGAPNGGINPKSGQPFSLVTTTREFKAAEASGHWDLSVPVAKGEPLLSESKTGYDPIDGAPLTGDTSGWMLGAETTTTVVMPDAADNIVSKTRYDALGRVVESRAPGANGNDAGTDIVVYYTVGANPHDAACGNSPQWAGLPCVTRSGEATPTLPESRTTGYSMLLAPTTVVESLGQVARTSTTTYLADGRTSRTSLAVTGLTDSTPLAHTRIEYDAATGLPLATVEFDSAGGEISRVSNASDLWGRNTSYTDRDGAVTSHGFDNAGRLHTVSDPHRTVTYTYDGTDALGREEHRGLATTMTVSGAGAFTAAYGVAGEMLRQQMPGGLTQVNTYSLTGEAESLAYVSDDRDGGEVPLIAWTQVNDLYGRVVSETTPATGQAADLVAQFGRSYTYDRADRLTKVDDRTALLGELLDDDTTDAAATPCVTRAYDFDVRGNRLARSTSVSGTDGVCGTGTSFTDAWTYDDADRVHTGANGVASYVYDALGRQRLIPAIDSPMGAAAGDLAIGYFDNDLVRSLSQDGTSTVFGIDVLGRRTDAVSTSASGTVTLSRHYGDATDSPAWVTRTDSAGTSLTWYGSSLGGDLGLEITDGVVALQIADLHGDVATSVTLDEAGAVAAVGAFADFDEYGRVLTVQPDTGALTYGWLGAKERATDAATGLLLMGVRLYNPVTGLFTSVDPVAGGNTTAYAYPQDPINKYDLDGRAWGWLKKVAQAAKVVAKVAEVASFIPGPIGMVAAGVATAAHLATGDYKAAAAAAIGLVPGGKLLGTAARLAGKAAKSGTIAKVVRKVAPAIRRTGCNSFEQGTAVLLADGSSTPIEQVVVGDLVVATDPLTGETVAKPVTDLIRHLDDEKWVDVAVATDAGVDTVRATAEHPFWVASARDVMVTDGVQIAPSGRWVNAADLAEGDMLATATGSTGTVLEVRPHEATRWAYNFTVADLHTYYVGEEPLLVHNASCSLQKNNFVRVGKTPDQKWRVSLGPERKHWATLSPWRQRIQRHHIHMERAKGGITNNATGTSRRLWGSWVT
ncbi:DNRLRE domain-containing protein [Demequina sp.]|uniref:DNRLRE domain-containing protein n=1 Tax=Demequina sp. TaxID=2050685 RepID=UPI003A8BA659